MYNPRNYRLVFDFLLDLETYIKALKEEEYAKAAGIAERDLFTDGAALFGEGFGSAFTDALAEMKCGAGVADECPLAVSAFFRAMAVFASAGKANELESGRS